MNYKILKFPTEEQLAEMSWGDIFWCVIQIEQAKEFNQRLYNTKQQQFAEAIQYMRAIFGDHHQVLDLMARLEHTIPKPPELEGFHTLLDRVRRAFDKGGPSQREALLAEMEQLGLSTNTNKSVPELQRIIERHYVKRLRKQVMNYQPYYQNYDKTACHPKCDGWDGVNATCNCGRSALRWKLGPSHTIATPQIIAVRIGVRDPY